MYLLTLFIIVLYIYILYMRDICTFHIYIIGETIWEMKGENIFVINRSGVS